MTRYIVVILTLAGMACGGPLPPSTDSTALLAQSVTIYRDRYGVPYIHGTTDAGAVFGFAYAQAEDNFPQIEDSYIHALGRAAEAYGGSKIPEDWLNRALEVTSLSRAEYERLDPRPRQLCDAFAAGLNYFLASHPGIKPRLLTRLEGWHVLALLRHRRHQRESVEVSGLSPSELKALGSGGTRGGSTGWR
jgi:acyl-homoserine-lactone acylase